MAGEKSGTVVMPRTIATKVRSVTDIGNLSVGSLLPRNDYLTSPDVVRSLRNSGRFIEAIRKLAKEDGTVSAAVYNYVQVANSGFSVQAYDAVTHEFSVDGTRLAASVLAWMDTMNDYTQGFDDKPSVEAIVETALREAVITGANSGELVLDMNRLPDRIQLIPFEQIQWKAKKNGRRSPVQTGVGSGEVDLDIPTFFVTTSHQEAKSSYPSSMMQAALQSVFQYMEFIEDMRRAVRRTGHSRLWVKLDAERVREMAPPEARNDPKKMQAFMDSVRVEVETALKGLEPEDAIVAYDVAIMETLEASGEKTDYVDMVKTLAGLMATSLKSQPSILGLRLEGSQSLSNTESMVFLKIAKAVQRPVQDFMSRLLTLATRLYGADVFVKFKFDAIDLRPENEVAAFKTMQQQGTLELLSLGFLTDDEAAVRLRTGFRPAGAPPLSGTMFYNRSAAKQPSPNEDPQGRALQSDSPSKAGGKSQ